jgi:hypothetical protein
MGMENEKGGMVNCSMQDFASQREEKTQAQPEVKSYADLLKELNEYEAQIQEEEAVKEEESAKLVHAATIIQAAYRGYQCRKQLLSAAIQSDQHNNDGSEYDSTEEDFHDALSHYSEEDELSPLAHTEFLQLLAAPMVASALALGVAEATQVAAQPVLPQRLSFFGRVKQKLTGGRKPGVPLEFDGSDVVMVGGSLSGDDASTPPPSL